MDVVANVQILAEGYNFEGLKTVFVRDSSRLPAIQISGRALRLHESKADGANIVQSIDTHWPFTRTASATSTNLCGGTASGSPCTGRTRRSRRPTRRTRQGDPTVRIRAAPQAPRGHAGQEARADLAPQSNAVDQEAFLVDWSRLMKGREEKMYRQGDVLITAVASVPPGAERLAATAGRFVLAAGEATGHSHSVLEAPPQDVGLLVGTGTCRDVTLEEGVRALRAPTWTVSAYEKDGVMYLVTAGVVEVTHQEHSTILLPPGTYQVGRQRGIQPDGDSQRRGLTFSLFRKRGHLVPASAGCLLFIWEMKMLREILTEVDDWCISHDLFFGGWYVLIVVLIAVVAVVLEFT